MSPEARSERRIGQGNIGVEVRAHIGDFVASTVYGGPFDKTSEGNVHPLEPRHVAESCFGVTRRFPPRIGLMGMRGRQLPGLMPAAVVRRRTPWRPLGLGHLPLQDFQLLLQCIDLPLQPLRLPLKLCSLLICSETGMSRQQHRANQGRVHQYLASSFERHC